MGVTVRDIVDAVDRAFPYAWAEPWDRVGLLVGDPDAEVMRVLVSLDPTVEAIERARSAGAQVLVTHHPAYLSAPGRLTPGEAGAAFVAASTGIALVAAHTNLDRAPEAAGTLPAMLGLEPGVPVEDALLSTALVTVYVPPYHRGAVADAMTSAGAGRIGRYTGCSFEAEGTGRFTAPSGSNPHTGREGETAAAEEVRVEMVADRSAVPAVVAAARAAHPYEEPLITVADVTTARGDARMGRRSELEEPTTLAAFARHAADVFGCTPRVWGDADTVVRTVVTATGSAGSLVSAALRSGADVLLAGEVRYHDAQAACAAGLCVVEIGHDVSEWPLVPVLAHAVALTPGLTGDAVDVDAPKPGWWTPRRSE